MTKAQPHRPQRSLTNILYTGNIRYRADLIPGEHAPIVDQATFDAVQSLLQRQHRSGGAETKTKHHALLRGLLVDAEATDLPKAAARTALAQFEPVWSALVPTERAQLLRALVERIRVDGQTGKVSFVFRAGGIAALARQAGGSSARSGEP